MFYSVESYIYIYPTFMHCRIARREWAQHFAYERMLVMWPFRPIRIAPELHFFGSKHDSYEMLDRHPSIHPAAFACRTRSSDSGLGTTTPRSVFVVESIATSCDVAFLSRPKRLTFVRALDVLYANGSAFSLVDARA